MINRNFGKFENGQLKYAPNPLWVGETMIANPTDEMYIENGYKPIEYTEAPIKEGYYFMPKYTEADSKIIQSWEKYELLEVDQNE